MSFFISLLVDGLLAGAIYALIALAFVVVYKTSRMINFALGEWAMLGARLVMADVSAADGTPRHDPRLLAGMYAHIFRGE